jgi:hypothetical protein
VEGSEVKLKAHVDIQLGINVAIASIRYIPKTNSFQNHKSGREYHFFLKAANIKDNVTSPATRHHNDGVQVSSPKATPLPYGIWQRDVNH